MDTTSLFRLTTRGMRAMLALASLLVLIIGLSAFFLPRQTDTYFSWTISSPLTAAFLGGAYLASCMLELAAAREKHWVNARIAVPAVLFFTSLTLLVTLLHLDKFHFDSPRWDTVAGTWVWLVVYLTVPLIMTALWIMQARLAGEDPPRSAPMPAWARSTFLIQGLLMFVPGLLLLLATNLILPVWPWPLTLLTGRAVGAWGIGLGTAALHMAWEKDWRRVRAGLAGSALFGLLQLINLARFGDEFQWDSVGGIIYTLLLLTVAVIGAIGLRRT